jgi:hypothetical protein
VTCQFSGNVNTKAFNGLVQEPFRVAPGVLALMKDSFNALAHSADETIEVNWVLLFLVFALHCPQLIARALIQLALPVGINEAFIAIVMKPLSP